MAAQDPGAAACPHVHAQTAMPHPEASEQAAEAPRQQTPLNARDLPTGPAAGPVREGFRTIEANGLNWNHTALRLWRKAKRLGIWNPDDLDFSKDIADWQQLSELQREVLLQLASQFLGGEEAVTLDLLPLLGAVASDGYLEDEMFLTSFLFEEAKHVDFFDRFLREMAGGQRPEGQQYFTDSYRRLFFDELPRAMQRLNTDRSPERQAEAVVVYNMIVEGVIGESGYRIFHSILSEHNFLPGTLQGVRLVQQDEARHLRYAVYLLERLIAEHGESVYEAVLNKMEALMPVALRINREGYVRLAKRYGQGPQAIAELRRLGEMNFGLRQYQKRMARIEKARGKRLEEVLYGGTTDPELAVEADAVALSHTNGKP